MVVLADHGDEYVAKGLTPAKLQDAFATISHDHGMPIDTSLRDRMAATAPACRAVVAARLHAPDAVDALLRALRVCHFAGEHLDERSTRASAARDAGLDPAELESWIGEGETETVLDEDRAASRNPTAASLAQDDRLAPWEGGRRYTCPSLEIVALDTGTQIDVPGFQPYAAYEVAIANVAPAVAPRDTPASVLELLEWAGEPLATREVAVVCEIGHERAREELGRVANERHLGFDGLWSPA